MSDIQGLPKPKLTPRDLVRLYPGTTEDVWAHRRSAGNGPEFYKIGTRVFYDVEDVQAWEQSLKRSTSRRGVA